jgi:capping protein beta
MGVDTSAGGKPFIKHEYNRDGESYRSPWSNTYFPPIEGGFYPSSQNLLLEKKANQIFEQYVRIYYDEPAVSSVYITDSQTDGFNACYLVKKLDKECSTWPIRASCWDAVHIVSCTIKQGT